MTMGFGPMSSCPKFTVSDAFLVTEVEFAMAAVMTPQFFYVLWTTIIRTGNESDRRGLFVKFLLGS